jgi:hypothetical protein
MDFRQAALAVLALLVIAWDQHTDARACDETVTPADQFRLARYDAADLELAHRSRLPLAKLDNEMRTVAIGLGLKVLGNEPP